MSTEELLRPRYKVIARWPGMELEPFRLGEIVTLQPHKDDEGDCFIHIPNKHVPGSYMREGFFTNYPHLFKPLHWATERKVEEMPQYVKSTASGQVRKVYRHWTIIVLSGQYEGPNEAPGVCSFEEDEESGFMKQYWRYDSCIPATLQDYEQYLSQHK